ncbi:hypothetical protein ACA910_005659 [Epithemia clementina (nom. ined.)]
MAPPNNTSSRYTSKAIRNSTSPNTTNQQASELLFMAAPDLGGESKNELGVKANAQQSGHDKEAALPCNMMMDQRHSLLSARFQASHQPLHHHQQQALWSPNGAIARAVAVSTAADSEDRRCLYSSSKNAAGPNSHCDSKKNTKKRKLESTTSTSPANNTNEAASSTTNNNSPGYCGDAVARILDAVEEAQGRMMRRSSTTTNQTNWEGESTATQQSTPQQEHHHQQQRDEDEDDDGAEQQVGLKLLFAASLIQSKAEEEEKEKQQQKQLISSLLPRDDPTASNLSSLVQGTHPITTETSLVQSFSSSHRPPAATGHPTTNFLFPVKHPPKGTTITTKKPSPVKLLSRYPTTQSTASTSPRSPTVSKPKSARNGIHWPIVVEEQLRRDHQTQQQQRGTAAITATTTLSASAVMAKQTLCEAPNSDGVSAVVAVAAVARTGGCGETAIVVTPTNLDVLCGRGGLINKHPGNIVYRRVVDHNKRLYKQVPKRHRNLVSQSIVQTVMKHGGRFLWLQQQNAKQKHNNNKSFPSREGGEAAASKRNSSPKHGSGSVAISASSYRWTCVPFNRAVQKTSQALREPATMSSQGQDEGKEREEENDCGDDDEGGQEQDREGDGGDLVQDDDDKDNNENDDDSDDEEDDDTTQAPTDRRPNR